MPMVYMLVLLSHCMRMISVSLIDIEFRLFSVKKIIHWVLGFYHMATEGMYYITNLICPKSIIYILWSLGFA